jgi:TPR repeat protein
MDKAVACTWFEKSAAGHIPVAAHFLAQCFEQGIGRPADPARAADWYRRAAELGHHISLCSLADLYMSGKGVEQDPQQGLALCRQAAENGAMPALVRVGRYLLQGDERIRDPQAAHAWLIKAAGFSPEAQYYLGVIHRDGLGHEASAAEARHWFERAASQGYVPAYFQTARLYFEVSPDYRTQPPPADDLAKAYMWLSATVQRTGDPDELEQTRAMLEQVGEIMPESWAPTLDERVSVHLAKYPPAS